MFEITLEDGGLIKLSGRFDATQTERARAVLKTLDRSATADFADLDYISSAGLGIIVETYKRLHDAGHGLRLIHLNPRIRSIFTYSGLDKVMQIE
ncbi:MAG: STAS domain-containing protein [Candidatus Latescibacteria bacterium]|nr:STAS domain-containing protein [Candidatus Latescibacterota bacterium]